MEGVCSRQPGASTDVPCCPDGDDGVGHPGRCPTPSTGVRGPR